MTRPRPDLPPVVDPHPSPKGASGGSTAPGSLSLRDEDLFFDPDDDDRWVRAVADTELAGLDERPIYPAPRPPRAAGSAPAPAPAPSPAPIPPAWSEDTDTLPAATTPAAAARPASLGAPTPPTAPRTVPRSAPKAAPSPAPAAIPPDPEAARRARWPRVRSLFEALADCPPAEREQMMLRLAEGPSASEDALAVVRELRELLASHDQQRAADDPTGQGFLETPAPERWPPGRPDRRRQRLGPWQLVAPLGRGGMADVWSARRNDGAYDADVAVKLMGHRQTDAEFLQRFRAEQHVLARLDHPHIARLLDAGHADDGTPYFVMEAVQGRRIDEACAGRPLADRLALFLQLCETVQFAHQRLLVHRDLKPANVLVTDGDQVKLLDFGIAGDLNTPDLGDAVPPASPSQARQPGSAGTNTSTSARTTATGFTPWCASPEQIRGERLGTATDVYSLGVLLHLLLTGTRPYGREARNINELMDAVLTEAPVPASRAPRPEDPARAVPAKALRGDLDAILARAMAKPLEQRYPSVAALADDLRAHLARLPVKARAWTWRYRANRFVARHRAAVGTGTIALAGLLVLVAGLAWQVQQTEQARQAAEARSAQVRALANRLVFSYHDRIANLAGALPVREALLSDALQYLDGMVAQAPADPGLARELAETYHRIASLYGETFSPSLERLADADGALKRALALQPLYLQQPELPVAALTTAIDMWLTRGQMLARAGRVREAASALGQAEPLVQRALAAAPDSLEVRSRQGTLLGRQAFVLGTTAAQANLGQVDQALALWQRAVPVFERMTADEPGNPEWQHQLGWALSGRTAVAMLHGDAQDALSIARRTLALREQAAQARPDDAHLSYQTAIAQLNLASALQATGDSAAALATWRQGHDRIAAAVATEPGRRSASRDLLLSRLTGARLAVQAGDTGLALPELRAVLAALPQGADLDGDFYLRRWRAQAELLLAQALLASRPAEALLHAEAAERLMVEAPPDPDNAPRRWMQAQALGEQALAMAALGRPGEARSRALLSRQAWISEPPGLYRTRSDAVRALEVQG